MNKLFVSLILLMLTTVNYAQVQKSLDANNVLDNSISLDGELTEVIYTTASFADNFIVNFPTPGGQSRFNSKCFFFYDREAIYISAELQDPSPDSVYTYLSQRDDVGNADWFGVQIDPYGAGQNGFGFYVTAAGVELDAVMNSEDEDYSWNAVWKSVVKRTEYGWSLEMKIPLTQLRYSKDEVQNWRINFKRVIRRNREVSHWNFVDPQQFGELAQSGILGNLNDLVSPLRLSLSPYTTGYVNNVGDGTSSSIDLQQKFGMDLKWGINESFTLDATLIPDFGQTVSDNLVLNLGPFEQRYPENRPFFLEGIDLFGISDLFYSRRIGADAYLNNEALDSMSKLGGSADVISNKAPLINATKISGRTSNGLGVGVFNAVEKNAFLNFKDSLGIDQSVLIHPWSNYNMLVLNKNFENNNSISFVNANVLRPEIDVISNVSSFVVDRFTKDRKFNFGGSGLVSLVNKFGEFTSGRQLNAYLNKVSGVWNYNFEYNEGTPSYDPTELGYIDYFNYRGGNIGIRYKGLKPWRNTLRRNFRLSTEMWNLSVPSKFTQWSIQGGTWATFKNYLSSGIEFQIIPVTVNDWFESRRENVNVQRPANGQISYFYSSDYSRPFALDVNATLTKYDRSNMYDANLNISPRFLLSSRFNIILRTELSKNNNDYGYVYVSDSIYEDQTTLGNRNRQLVNNSVSADYIFTNRMGLTLRFNHYWQTVDYDRFMTVDSKGKLLSTPYSGLNTDGTSIHDRTFNNFVVDVNFRWIIYPGSELRFTWKYNISSDIKVLTEGYFNNFESLFNNPYLNQFSLRLLLFFDAGRYLKRSN